jgi:hypothetical protein
MVKDNKDFRKTKTYEKKSLLIMFFLLLPSKERTKENSPLHANFHKAGPASSRHFAFGFSAGHPHGEDSVKSQAEK